MRLRSSMLMGEVFKVHDQVVVYTQESPTEYSVILTLVRRGTDQRFVTSINARLLEQGPGPLFDHIWDVIRQVWPDIDQAQLVQLPEEEPDWTFPWWPT